LAKTFLEQASARHGREVGALPPSIVRLLMDYGWPGNVRELSNAIERLVLLAEDERLSVEDLPAPIRETADGAGATVRLPVEGLVWDAMEESLLRQALDRVSGNRAAAARLLGLSYKAFLYRLEKHDLVDGVLDE
jgi:DNA-binding NtrC family response regulator